jgi:CBS domain-containing protein
MAEPMTVGMSPVSLVMNDQVAWIRPDASVTEVCRALRDADVGLLVIQDNPNHPHTARGVVSERDVIRAIATGADPELTSALEMGWTELSWCEASATVAEVAEEMMERYIRHVLVKRDGRLVGVVSARDLLGSYAAADTYANESP